MTDDAKLTCHCGSVEIDLLFQMGSRMLADVRVQYAAENMQHMLVSI